MRKWAYEMTNEGLIQAFARACAEAGLSSSGLVIDLMGPAHASEARYLKSVLLARLEGQKPPFSRGDVVHSKSGASIRAVEYGTLSATPGPHEILRIHYEGNGKWLLEIRDIPEGTEGTWGTPKFPAEEFVLVPALTAA